MDRTLIESYRGGAEKLAAEIAGLTRDELIAYPVPGTWSIQQIVVHLLDSDLIASERMKRIIAMNNPLLMGYDESAAADQLFYHDQDIAAVCELFRLNRLHTTEILRRLPDEAFARTGIHSERGKLTLRDFVAGYSDHLENHLKFIRRKRELLGKGIGA